MIGEDAMLALLVALGSVFMALLTSLWFYNGNSLSAKKNATPIPIPPFSHGIKNHINLLQQHGGLAPFLDEMHRRYGQIVQFYLPSAINPSNHTHYVSVNDPALISKTASLGDRPSDLFAFLNPLLGADNLQVFDAKRAKAFRQSVAQAFGHSACLAMESKIQLITTELMDSFVTDLNFPLQKHMLEFGFSTSVLSALSLHGQNSSVDLVQFFKEYEQCLGLLFEKQFQINSEHADKGFDESILYVKSVFRDLIQQAKTRPDDKYSLLYHLKIDPQTLKPYTNDMLETHLSSYLLAGYHTNSTALTWTMYCVADKPELQEQLVEEIQRECGDDISMRNLTNCKLLHRVLKESMRLHTPGPFAARLVTQDRSIGPFVLKKDTTLLYPLATIHKNTQIWDSPNKFQLDRPAYEKGGANGFCAFGIGARRCPGEQLALTEMTIFLASFVQRFKFQLTNPNDRPKEVHRFANMPSHEILLRLTSRS